MFMVYVFGLFGTYKDLRFFNIDNVLYWSLGSIGTGLVRNCWAITTISSIQRYVYMFWIRFPWKPPRIIFEEKTKEY